MSRRRNKPTAKLVGRPPSKDEESELAELVAQGRARPPRVACALPKSFWSEALPEASVDLIGLIREDRDGR